MKARINKDKLKAIMFEQAMETRELARLTALSHATILRLLRVDNTFKLSTILAVAAALDVDHNTFCVLA